MKNNITKNLALEAAKTAAATAKAAGLGKKAIVMAAIAATNPKPGTRAGLAAIAVAPSKKATIAIAAKLGLVGDIITNPQEVLGIHFPGHYSNWGLPNCQAVASRFIRSSVG